MYSSYYSNTFSSVFEYIRNLPIRFQNIRILRLLNIRKVFEEVFEFFLKYSFQLWPYSTLSQETPSIRVVTL
jgi:hypothetical protein